MEKIGELQRDIEQYHNRIRALKVLWKLQISFCRKGCDRKRKEGMWKGI